MRTLLLLGLALGGAFMAGWFTIERDGDRTRIEINKSEVRSDVGRTIDRVQEIRDRRQQERWANQTGEFSNGAQPMPGTGSIPPDYSPPAANFGGQAGFAPQPDYSVPGNFPSQPNFQPQPGYTPQFGAPNQPGNPAQNQRWSGNNTAAPWAPNR